MKDKSKAAIDLRSAISRVFSEGDRETPDKDKRAISLENISKVIASIPEIDQREYLEVTSPSESVFKMATYWISILERGRKHPGKWDTYIAYIFKKDFTGVFLYIHQFARTRDRKSLFGEDEIPMIKLKNDYQRLTSSGFNLDMKVSSVENRTGGFIGETVIGYKYYPRENLPKNDILMEDLRNVLTVFDRYSRRKSGSGITISDESIMDFSRETGFDRESIEYWKRQLFRKKNVIFQGPPGTGKTFLAEKLARHLIRGTDGRMEIVYFHPNYSYEDFIQGFRPVVEKGALRYETEDGIFKKFCEEAERHDTEPYVMLIDEINRAKLSRVFGELMYLLEYRDKEVVLEAGEEKFRIPDNIYIIGTMNTADRSIALVDHALRRRFTFINIPPNYEVLRKHLEKYRLPAESLISTLKQVNMEINDPKYEVGISFFLKNGIDLKDNLRNIWEGEVEPYLREYFYDVPKKMEQFTWENLSRERLKDWTE